MAGTLATALITCALLMVQTRSGQFAQSRKDLPVKGIAIHFCSCKAPCGCMFSANGTDMEGCNLTAVYHFTSGGYVSKGMDGLTMVVVSRPKALRDGKDTKSNLLNKQGRPVDLAVYLPQTASEEQKRNLKFALVEHMMQLAWGNFIFRDADISFKRVGAGFEVEIPGVLKARTSAIIGSEKKPMELTNVPFAESSRWTLGRSSVHNYSDPQEVAWKWSLPNGSNGAWTNFSWRAIYHP